MPLTKLTPMIRLLSALLILFFLSCQKEVASNLTEQVPTQSNGCKLITSRVHNAAGLPTKDSALYYYQGDKVYKITGGDPADSVILEYAANKIVKRKHFSSSVLIGYDNINYHADGTVKSIVGFWDAGIPGLGMQRMDSTVFSYAGGKLSKRQVYLIDIFNTSPDLVLDEENIFTFTGNNLTKEIRRNYNNSGTLNWVDTSLIQFDTQPNLLKKQAFPHLEADPIFWEGYGYSFALFVSENNVATYRDPQFPTSLQNFTYTKDAKGNLSEIGVNGVTILSYKMNCP